MTTLYQTRYRKEFLADTAEELVHKMHMDSFERSEDDVTYMRNYAKRIYEAMGYVIPTDSAAAFIKANMAVDLIRVVEEIDEEPGPGIYSIEAIAAFLHKQADLRAPENDEGGILQDLAEQLERRVAALEGDDYAAPGK